MRNVITQDDFAAAGFGTALLVVGSLALLSSLAWGTVEWLRLSAFVCVSAGWMLFASLIVARSRQS